MTPPYPITPEALIALLRLHPDPVGYVMSLTAYITPESVKAGGAARDATYNDAWEAARNASRNASRGAAWAAAWGTARGIIYTKGRTPVRGSSYVFCSLASATVVLDILPDHHAHVLAEAVLSYLPKETKP